jgi:membrane-bound transcription factor site-1 protease
MGYFIEILAQPITCVDASNYGVLLLIDVEDFFSEDEIQAIRYNVEVKGLSLIVAADWYN